MQMTRYDYLIVGAGFAGCVLGERLASCDNKRCLIVDRRHHIGGNSYDFHNRDGVLVHGYGPHYFHTNAAKVVEYLSHFTEWHQVDFKVLTWVDGCYWRFPINLNTFEQLIRRKSCPQEMSSFLEKWREKIVTPKNSEEAIISQVGVPLYEMFYKNYTRKQWGCDPKDLSPSVCRRIPIRVNRDDRYFDADFQALPRMGYSVMFQKMVKHPNIDILLNTDFRAISRSVKYRHLIYTGPIDEYYDYCFGRLSYRSLRFEHETLKQEFFQPVVQVNFPNAFDYTRIVEIKHATGQTMPITTIVREYPQPHSPLNEPFYPVPNEGNYIQYRKYAELANGDKERITFVGRLGTYQYYDMDQIVAQALTTWSRLRKQALPQDKGPRCYVAER